ncbi:hypothetical protein [Calidifontibacter terrae]
MAPVATGSNVGSGNKAVVTPSRSKTQPRTIHDDRLAAAYQSVDSLLTEAEDSVVALGKREAERSALYAEPERREDSELRAKYGVQQ